VSSPKECKGLSLEAHRAEFASRRLLAMPLAGAIAWALVAIASLVLSPFANVWVLFIATGSIAYLGIGLSKLTGEDFLDRSKPKNPFDRLFMAGVVQAILVYGIAIPFFLVDYTSLPLTVGILTGLMWMPVSWILQHWIGTFHAVARTALVLAAWYAFPEQRFLAVPIVVIAIYGVTIAVLERRWRAKES
jgi:hypothetical protein